MPDSTLGRTRARTSPAPLVVAHRGASGHEPENTLRAFARAIDAGATWIELDVQRLEDRLVVLHDETVDRTTDGTGHLQQHTLAQLRTLDAGGGERIPLLDDVLDLVAGRAGIHVELKGAQTAAPAVALLTKALASSWPAGSFVLSSFNWERLIEVRALAPDLPIAALINGAVTLEAIEAAARLGVEAIHVGKWAARAGIVREAHARGLAVRVFTVNERWEYELMRRIEVDAVFTDVPENALSWARDRNWRGASGAADPSLSIA